MNEEKQTQIGDLKIKTEELDEFILNLRSRTDNIMKEL